MNATKTPSSCVSDSSSISTIKFELVSLSRIALVLALISLIFFESFPSGNLSTLEIYPRALVKYSADQISFVIITRTLQPRALENFSGIEDISPKNVY